MRTRSRTCTSPPPAHDGKNCDELGPASEEEACNEDPCGENSKIADSSECWAELCNFKATKLVYQQRLIAALLHKKCLVSFSIILFPEII